MMKKIFTRSETVARCVIIFQVVLLLLICIMHALFAGHYSNFFPTNGTFQNYNPVRRLLSGQIPYKDFQDYLGLGHLYSGALVTVLFGGTYNASLVAFSLLTIVSYAGIFVCIGKSIFRRTDAALAFTNIMLLMTLIQPYFYTNLLSGTDDIAGALNSAMGPGNSARYVRGMALPVTILLLYLAEKVGDKLVSRKNIRFINKYKNSIIIGICAGFSFVWSNDYGISCFVCLIIMAIWIEISKRNNWRCVIVAGLLEIFASIFGILFFASLFTVGHPISYLQATFGTGSYQSWYYNSGKSCFIYDVDFSYIMLIQALVCVLYLILLFKNKASRDSLIRFGVPGFANMVSFCAVNEYQILSGGGAREVALTVLLATVLAETIIFFGQNFRNKRKVAIIISFVVGIAWCGESVKEEFIFRYATEKDGTYIEALDGNVTTYADDLLNTHDFLKGESFFATYASAQEIVENQFQPSGTDYIIHALGDKPRKEYLESFLNGDFTYAATIRDVGFSDWEGWISRANWFFYRELYRSWHPVYSNSYETYWERNEGDNIITDTANINYSYLDNGSIKVEVQLDNKADGIGEIRMKYSVKKNESRMSSLIFRTYLKIQNNANLYRDSDFYEMNYLPADGDEYIPVTIENGYGELILSGIPEHYTVINIDSLEFTGLYPVLYQYAQVIDVNQKEDVTMLTLSKQGRWIKELSTTSEIVIDGESYAVSEYTEDDNYSYITINKNVDVDLTNGNMFQIR